MCKQAAAVHTHAAHSVKPLQQIAAGDSSLFRDEFIRGSTLLKGICPSLNALNARLRARLSTGLLPGALPFSPMKAAHSLTTASL